MVTKAELEVELLQLRQQSAERDAGRVTVPEPTPDPAPEPDLDPSGDWAKILGDLGLENMDPAGLLDQLTKELGDVPRNKPLLSAAAAFGLGFVLGRMSK